MSIYANYTQLFLITLLEAKATLFSSSIFIKKRLYTYHWVYNWYSSWFKPPIKVLFVYFKIFILEVSAAYKCLSL